MTIKEQIRELKYRQFRWALEQTQGNQRAASRMLGCTNSLGDRWIKELGLQPFAESLRKQKTWWLPRRTYDANNLGQV